MSDLSAKFSGLEELLVEQNTAILAALTNIFDTLDTLNNNASANTQALLQAIANSSCPCDPNAPLLPTPPSTDPFTPTTALCKRDQAFLDLFRFGFGVNLGAYIQSVGYAGRDTIARLQSEALSAVDISSGALASGMPVSTASAAESAIAAARSEMTGTALGAALISAFDDDGLWGAVRDAIYTASDPSTALSEAHSAISSGLADAGVAAIINQLFYAAWVTDMLAESPSIDDSGYSGTACAEPACLTFGSIEFTGYYGGICWDLEGWYDVTVDTNPDQLGLQVANRDFYHYTVQATGGGSHIEFRSDGGNFSINDGLPHTVAFHTTYAYVLTTNADGAFTVQMCSPGV